MAEKATCTLPNGSKAKMHVSYGPDTDAAQDASLEKQGDYDIELTARSQELGGQLQSH